MTLDAITDALRAAQKRGLLPTSLGTAELRELGAQLLARSVFSARASNTIFVSDLKKVIDQLTAGNLGEGQARTALWEVLDMLDYDSEKGGFPGEELEPALKGTLQDLKSFRRRDLIVRTQRDLMQGAGAQMRGQDPDRLSEFPAWELGPSTAAEPRIDWDSRWVIAGGKVRADGRKIALKGDPVWGELGSYENFPDALGVDHSPFCFGSTRKLIEISREEVRALGITGPDGETPEEFLASEPVTLSGRQPLPSPQVSLNGVDPALIERFRKAVKAETGGKPYVFDYSDILEKELTAADAAYQRGAPTR